MIYNQDYMGNQDPREVCQWKKPSLGVVRQFINVTSTSLAFNDILMVENPDLDTENQRALLFLPWLLELGLSWC